MNARSLSRRLRLAVVGLSALVLLTGCGGAFLPTPAMTVQDFFLYINRGAMESAWQELDLPLQMPSRPRPAETPAGRPATALGWPSQAAFAREIGAELRPFLHGARVAERVGSQTASVTARAAGAAGATLRISLERVDNEWVFEDMVVSPAT